MTDVEILVNLLKEKQLHIVTAESCTGGLIASEIVSVNGSSEVFDESFVTYANSAKIKYLNVKEDTIEKFGVVSEEVAYQMANGAKNASKADIAISTTGIAGPTGGDEKHPVGTICFGVGIKNKIYTCTKHFGDLGRNKVRQKATDYIIKETIKFINKAY